MRAVLYIDADGRILGRLGRMPKLESQHKDLEGGKRYIEVEVDEQRSKQISFGRMRYDVEYDCLVMLPVEEWRVSTEEERRLEEERALAEGE